MSRKIILLFVLFLLIQTGLGVAVMGSGDDGALDMVKVNELMYSCVEAWPGLQQGREGSMPESGYNYALLDREGRLIYAQDKNAQLNVQLSLQEAIRRRDTIIDLYDGSDQIGKLVLLNDFDAQADRQRGRLLAVLGASTVLFMLTGICYVLYLEKTVFGPFRKLKVFAARVAGGNLDIPLTMDRDNAFGAFTESFDLMRAELKKAREQERRASQSKKELVAKLSHDIKTPVASIKAVAEVMAVGAGSEKEKQQLGIIEAKADQINALITNLFHATLEELQELEVKPEEQDSRGIKELLVQADYLKKAQIGDIPECLVTFDALRLQQVFDNLLENSYKYAGTSILITAKISQGYLSVVCRDYGTGVAEDEFPLIFEKFYRGSNTAGKGGSGLGLYISHYLMEKMGGSLICENLEDGFSARVNLKI